MPQLSPNAKHANHPVSIAHSHRQTAHSVNPVTTYTTTPATSIAPLYSLSPHSTTNHSHPPALNVSSLAKPVSTSINAHPASSVTSTLMTTNAHSVN
jgi:hypothetical protein